MTRREIADVLKRAADVLQTGGVCAGTRYREGAHCALGAINYVLNGNSGEEAMWPGDYKVAPALAEVLSLPEAYDRYNYLDYYGGPPATTPAGKVAAWSNNLVDAGKPEEVIAGFRRAAQLLLASEQTDEATTVTQ